MEDKGHNTCDAGDEDPDTEVSDSEDSGDEADTDEMVEIKVVTDLYEELNDFTISSL